MTQKNNFPTDPEARQAEAEYYAAHSWCLNPVLKLSDLFQRFDEELKHYGTWPYGWQRRESRINMYLFASSIACIIDDYIFWRPWDTHSVLALFHKFHLPGRLLLSIADLPYTLSSRKRLRMLHDWKSRWDLYLEDLCRLLLNDADPTETDLAGLNDRFNRLRGYRLPSLIFQRQMRIIEGYRRQDMTHHDVIAMADRFAESCPDRDAHIAVIGPRTAGTYFAPIVKIQLENSGFSDVSWTTIRPRKGIFPGEMVRLKRMLKDNSEVVVVDDYSNTGLTFRLVQETLTELGVRPDKITLLAPLHPRKPDIHLTDNPVTRVIKLEHKDLYKTRLLGIQHAQKVLKGYMDSRGTIDPEFKESPQVAEINSGFLNHYTESFQTRIKSLHEVSYSSAGAGKKVLRIFGKSVGWGWLGYHAYIAANRIEEFVPPLIGLRDGILYSEWVDGTPITKNDLSEKSIETMGSYVAQRALRLPLGEDPRFDGADVHSGWREIISILKRPYALRTGFFKHNVLRRYLRDSISPFPTLVDGRMFPQKWILNGSGITKTDFEHHNFGEPELDVVDPAYDLAIAAFEFQMSASEEEKMVAAYSELSGDRRIRERIFLYKLLYSYHVRRLTLSEIVEKQGTGSVRELNKRYIESWNSLIYIMNGYNGGFAGKPAGDGATSRLFFMDIDDVFDSYSFGFPHTTPGALNAISVLHDHDFTIIPNTGRSVEHVRNYCSSYGFPYGIGEYGGVFVKTREETEIPLIDAGTRNQMEKLRSVIEMTPGISTDPSYHYSIRAYRFSSYGTEPLTAREAEAILQDNGLDRLELMPRPDATYIVGKETDKGTALEFVRDALGFAVDMTYAIGDSDADIPMLTKAGYGFAPGNCSPRIRELARNRECLVVPGQRQRGLMQAAHRIVKSEKKRITGYKRADGGTDSLRDLIFSLMTRAEQSRFRRLAAVLRFNRL